MSHQLICICGLRYHHRGAKAVQKPRCPVCGRDLKVPSAGSLNLDLEPRSFAWVKIGIGVVSAIGLVALAVVILTPEFTGRTPPPPRVANAPVQASAVP